MNQLSYLMVAASIVVMSCSSADDPTRTPESVAWPARAFVEQLIPRFDELARQRVESITVADALRTRLQREAERPWGARLDGGLKYADLLLAIYESQEWTLAFSRPDGSTARALGIIERLAHAPADALDPALYHLSTIAKLQSELGGIQLPPTPSFALDAAEAEDLVTWLEAENASLHDPATRRRVVDAALGLRGAPLAPRLAALAGAYRHRATASNTAIAELEVRTADAALRYARDLRHFNYKRLSWPELEQRGGGKRVIYERLDATLRELFEAPDAASASDILVALRPELEQYDRLVDALARYRAMSDWPVVPPGIGAEYDAALAPRLAAEGYAQPALAEAIAAYQRTHQFEPGVPTAGFWRSLNIARPQRIAQIELTLQRYRESYYRGERDFVFVNIPDFHAEVFRNGERRMRIPVVVGNAERVCDAQTQQWRYPNATPVQWAPLEHLMLNPWWNVPSRLFAEEIAPRAHDAAWLAQKGYELYEDRGATHARQRPGPNNALGLVKFIFPNEHSTYMHDTPSKQYFARPVRAFSHGCVRVQDPLALAEHFMTEYDLGGRARLDRIIELGSTIRIDIPGAIPVFFEYYTVRVDDDGAVWFLADPYRLDETRLSADGEPQSCAPRALPEPVPTWGDATPEPANADDQGP